MSELEENYPSKYTPVSGRPDNKDLYVIGIGASAGGLQALQLLFQNIPQDSVSYVVVQHLSPDNRSMLTEYLAQESVLTVQEIEDGMPVEKNRVYVIPVSKQLIIRDDTLYLTGRSPETPGLRTVNTFFESLAAAKGNKAIGVILSGTGTDGTDGAAAIKKAGGLVLVQDPETAKFDGMPRSAIQAGYADLVLPPELMPDEIFNFVKIEPLSQALSELTDDRHEETLGRILAIVHDRTGLDFANYKRPTIIRRISRRMAMLNLNNLIDYLDYLQLHPAEIETISKEFLIGVTKFFRDEEAFALIQQKVIPDLIEEKRPKEQLRIWVAGCSTGEEAYSLAILVREYLNAVKKELEVKIFASDIDREALAFAGKGLYPHGNLTTVSPERLETYFTPEEGKYRVRALIRKMVIFSPHNLVSDPPFSKVDLVSCRNMLIYLNPALQKKIISKFHYALQQGGYLFLGSSESLGDMKFFVEVNKKWRIFRNVQQARPLGLETFSTGITRNNYAPVLPGYARNITPKLTINNVAAEALNETLLEEFKYAAVYVNEDYEVIHAAGDYNSFLTLPDKVLTMNLLKMVPPDLSLQLGSLLRKAGRDEETTHLTNVQVRDKDALRRLNLVVKPYLRDKSPGPKFILVLISEEKRELLVVSDPEKFWYEHQNEGRVTELEIELQHIKEDLQAVVEQLETANEELQSTNEELLSSNEELQSTNEELQSLNEELHTINAEHQYKIKVLLELDDDLNNYFRSTNISQIFLDRKLMIRKYTPAATQQINLIESDIGRSIYQISNNLQYSGLIEDIRRVIAQAVTVEREVQDKDDTWYQMRILPYLTQDNHVDGAIVLFVNINEIKNLHMLRTGILDSSVSMIQAFKAVRNAAGQIVDFEWTLLNARAQKFFNTEGDDFVGRRFRREFPGGSRPELFDKLVAVVENGQILDQELEYQPDNTRQWFHLVVVKLYDGLLVTLDDITHRKLAEEQIKQQAQELEESRHFIRQVAEASPDFIYVYDLDEQKNVYLNRDLGQALGFEPAEKAGPENFNLFNAMHPEDVPPVKELLQQFRVIGKDEIKELTYRLVDATGNVRWFHDRATIFKRHESGKPCQIVGIAQEITHSIHNQQILKSERNFSEKLLHNSIDGIVAFDTEARITAWNKMMEEYNGKLKEEVIGKSVFDLFPEYHVNDEGLAIRKALAGEKSVLHDHPYGLRDGYYETSNIPLFDEAGNVIGGFSIVHDITERKRMEDERINLRLNQQKEILSAILETQEAERKRISESLHNGLGQLLYAVKLKVSDLHTSESKDQKLQVNIDNLLDEAIKETRQLSFELMPSILKDFGLEAALSEICKRVSFTKINLTCEVINLNERLDDVLEIAIFRISQELLNNIIKHAQATEASIQLHNQKTKLVLRVEDNGVGFDLDKLNLTGLGLSSIKNRLALLDGTLDIDTEPGQGSRFTIKIMKKKLK
ncbi:MAG: Multidomain signal transduction protein including CheB-like methylesterase, CheR-like methyltransferase and BaeS-like histidine kinase [uncultured Adhaeribacter sp.]|uniref:protein-glutamate O-methyltransferase n=1 Tax=uncultured Adhaeribacter sp. TaxID=448109 RepID=A0A6J4ICJ9_9BACT|nr:MAG: Multidomain signal transduction protein including CheB-like methylesterase, CheR-like methyltransferase and BaeS-like histidine kinase [uncultured Adhaeribacter sp.]